VGDGAARRAPAVAFAGNAEAGRGGQGEFLRQMAFTLDAHPAAAVYARDPGACRAGITVPRQGWSRAVLSALRRVPRLRGRDDWTTLIDDLDFDAGVARRLGAVSIFDGIMGQAELASAAARRRGAALVVTSLNTHIDALASVIEQERARTRGAPRSFVHPRMQRRARRQIAMADWIRTPSRRAAGSFVERGADPSRVKVIRPGVDLTHFHPQPPRADGPFRVLAVTSVDLRKGAHHLLESFVAARLPNAELEIIGGTGSRWARDLVARSMRGRANITLRHADVMCVPVSETYGRASVLVHAALEDGFGLVVAQALASGRPVIVTDATGASELVEDGVNGFVVPAGSAAAIREKLELLASDAALARRMCEQAPRAVARLGYDTFAAAVLAFYREIAQ